MGDHDIGVRVVVIFEVVVSGVGGAAGVGGFDVFVDVRGRLATPWCRA